VSKPKACRIRSKCSPFYHGVRQDEGVDEGDDNDNDNGEDEVKEEKVKEKERKKEFGADVEDVCFKLHSDLQQRKLRVNRPFTIFLPLCRWSTSDHRL
jgi:hypothetical protein